MVALIDAQTYSVSTRSTRFTRQISIASIGMPQNNTAQTTSRKNYSINRNKTLKTKIENCQKVFVEYSVTGGGITGEMDTATFELFRSACTELFKDPPPPPQCDGL